MMNEQEEPIRFIHVRRPVVGYAMRGMYVPTSSSKGGITIAYQKVDAYYNVAFARCAPTDHFVKVEGKRIAQKRLLNDESLAVTLLEGEKVTKVFTDLAYQLREHRQNLKPEIVWDGKAGLTK